jgi:hypothetical protein
MLMCVSHHSVATNEQTPNTTCMYSSSSSCQQNDLTFLRVRTRKHEVLVAPDREYLLIVVQNPTAGEDSK